MDTLLMLENLSCRFGSLRAVDNVSLRIADGEFCAIIGPNGAGKTTLFNMISGLVAPTQGRIVFAARDLTRLAAQRRVRAGIVRTFQITEIFPELTLRETLRIGVESTERLSLRLTQSRAQRQRVDAAIDALIELGRLGGRADRPVGELSHGDQRTSEIVLGLALRPRLLLLDEPTAGMGDQETYDITELIRRLHAERGLTTVLIEHDMRVVFRLAARVVVLAEGAVIADGTPSQIADDEAVQRAYLGSA